MKNNQNLFFFPEEKGRAFSDVLKEVQEYISSKYSTLMVEGGSEERIRTTMNSWFRPN